MTTPNWRLLAAQKFLGASINGTGRYAVTACNRAAVWLTTTEQGAHAAALGGCAQVIPCQGNHSIFDLMPRSCPLPSKERADDHEDKAWLKRNA